MDDPRDPADPAYPYGSARPPQPPPLAPLPLVLEFQLTHEDLVDAVMEYSRRSRTAQIVSRGTIAGLGGFSLVALMATAGDSAGASIAMMTMAGFLFVSQFVSRRIQREQASAMLREGRNLFLRGPQRLVIDGDGITQANWVSESRMRWIGVERVEISPHHVMIYVGAGRTILVPRRAFPSDEACRSFVLTVRSMQARALEAAVRPAPALPGHP